MIVLWILLGFIALLFLLLCIPVQFDLNYNGAVSYTHLDVYKRQA